MVKCSDGRQNYTVVVPASHGTIYAEGERFYGIRE